MEAPMNLSAAAENQGRLWSSRARDWAKLQERVLTPVNTRALDHLQIASGTTLLDVGCGAGGATRTARERGARVSGIDAADGLLEIARERSPDGDFRLGEILDLPWPDDTFDFVTGFNSFQYAEDPVAALAEAKRVARPGGRVAIVVWGSPDDCEAVAHFRALGALMPPPPPNAPGPLVAEQDIDDKARAAGLEVAADELVDTPWEYPDLATALRALKSAGPVARVIAHAGEDAVDDALTGCLRDFEDGNGGYVFRNKFRVVIADVPS